MNALLKLNQNNNIKNASFILECFNKSILFKTSSSKLSTSQFQIQNSISTQTLFNNKKLNLFESSSPSVLQNSNRTIYSFNLSNRLIKFRRATRPKKSNDNSILLNYEQSQFIEKLGLTKSWNIWNTCKFFLYY
jgi:hypothetical protein